MLSVLLLTLWKIFPFYSLVVLTAFQTLQAELYEAARIDGAGVLACFRHITIPGIAPMLGLLTLLATIFSFRRFTVIYLLTGGGPADSTKTLVVSVYEHAFRFFDLSYGSTVGVAGLGVTLVIAAAYFAAQRRLAPGEGREGAGARRRPSRPSGGSPGSPSTSRWPASRPPCCSRSTGC